MYGHDYQRTRARLAQIVVTSSDAQQKVTFALQKPQDNLAAYSWKHETGPSNRRGAALKGRTQHRHTIGQRYLLFSRGL